MKKPQRFTKAEFKTFRDEFRAWQERLGLSGYKVYFFHQDIDAFADITHGGRDQVATVRLNNNVPEQDHIYADPKVHARHEAFHLMVSRLENCARSRFLRDEEIYEATEELVRRIEHLVSSCEAKR